MKKSLKLLFCATALASLAGCNKFDEADTAPDSGNGSLIKVYAKVAENDGTRANLHVGESAFTAEWEAGDALGILPVKTGGTAPATAAKFDYNATSAAFEGSLNDFAAGGGNYYAFFPHAKVTGTTANLPFGNLRTQTGNDFNSAYDALVATPRAYTADDEAGKADGKDVTFTLHRLTSILNFSIATVANSQVVIRATEQFLAYFHDARFTVTTASGNEFAFTPGSDPADEPVFVKGGTRLTVTGTARRQSPTGTGEGPEVTFSAQTLDATTPRTCHIITYDAKNAGSATLTITLGEDYTDTRTLDCEVNEGAIDDTEKK